MFLCSCCGRAFYSESELTDHFLKCWRAQNPFHNSKPAPRSADVNTREVAADIAKFFEGLK